MRRQATNGARFTYPALRAVCRACAREALCLGFHHRAEVVATRITVPWNNGSRFTYPALRDEYLEETGSECDPSLFRSFTRFRSGSIHRGNACRIDVRGVFYVAFFILAGPAPPHVPVYTWRDFDFTDLDAIDMTARPRG